MAVFNRTVSKVDDFINNEAKGTQVVGAHSIEELVAAAQEAAARDADGQGRRTVDQMIEQIAAAS